MFDYLQKFNNLPNNLRDSVSSPAAMAIISELENKYKIDLAATVMKVMVKIIPLADLSIYFVSDFSLDKETAKKLTADLKERLFFGVANYLGYNPSYSLIVPKTTPAPTNSLEINQIIKDSGVTFSGVELNQRFKSVLSTYLRGVRSRVDTRLTLNKEIISGGLGLDYKVIDKIFKLADEVINASLLPSGAQLALPKVEVINSGLEKVRALYEKQEGVRDIPYDLKTAISTGAIKKSTTPLNLPVPAENKEKLLEEPGEQLRIATASTSVPPKMEIRLTEDNDFPEIKTEPIVLAQSVVSTTPPVLNSVNINQQTADNFVPADHKITRPPEKKPGLISKIFTEEPKGLNKEIIKPEITPVNSTSSIVSLRAEATNNNNKEIKPIIQVSSATNFDNKTTPKIMGPIEELTYLDILNFRRLGDSPEEAVKKVELKIKLLEKDGYDKMVSGVLAWRSGIINNTYLKMGLDSLNKGISLKQYADDYQNSKNLSFLTWEEIENIINLNSRLLF